MTPDPPDELRCIGGAADGRLIAAHSPRLMFPVYTAEYAQAYDAWFEAYGLAWTAENLDSIPADPVTPPPPSMPSQAYERRRQGNTEFWQFVGETSP